MGSTNRQATIPGAIGCIARRNTENTVGTTKPLLCFPDGRNTTTNYQ